MKIFQNKKDLNKGFTQTLNFKKSLVSGFTLIEMVVVLGIFMIITAIIFYNYSDFKTGVSLDNLSQDIALTIRRAQSYATSVKGTNVLGAEFPGYGVHFATTSGNIYDGDPKSFILFADLAGPVGTAGSLTYEQSTNRCGYDVLATLNECLEKVSINTNDYISDICGYDSTNTYCGGTLDLVFTRPDPDAAICYIKPGLTTCEPNIFSASVKISSTGSSNFKNIVIWNTGQISIQ